MNYLVGIPCLYGVLHTNEAIQSAKREADVLCIDNGAEPGVKQVIHDSEVAVISNPENIYVNPAWNQIMEYFLAHPEYDVLCIMNSDLILPIGWKEALDNFYAVHDAIPVPVQISDKRFIPPYAKEAPLKVEPLTEGIAGVFICLTRKQCRAVHPIPPYLKVWFGDNWIYDILRGCGETAVLYKNMHVYHAISQNVSKANVGAIIEDDKKGWSEKGVQAVQNRIYIEKHNL